MLHRLPYISLLVAFLIAIGAVICHALKVGPPLAIWVGTFLFVFGLGKGCVGLGKLALLKRVPAGGPDPRLEFANPTLFWFFVIFKFVTWTVAWGVGLYLFNHPLAFISK